MFTLGGSVYGIIEIVWRHYTHWTMILTGGMCFLILFRYFDKAGKGLSLFKKCVTGSAVITAIELVVGCIVNLQFKMHVWDYSNLPLNILGQVTPVYSVLWGLLTIPICYACNKVKVVLKKI